MNKIQKIISIAGITLTLLAGGGYLISLDPNYTYQTIAWERPTTDEQWAKESIAEALHIRSDEQLVEIIVNHKLKLIRILTEYSRVEGCPDCVKGEIAKNLGQNYTSKELETSLARLQVLKDVKSQFPEVVAKTDFAKFNVEANKGFCLFLHCQY